jgi:hypothetical protein
MLWHLYRYFILGICSFLRHGGPSVCFLHYHLYAGPCSGILTRREKEKIIGSEVRLRSIRAVFFLAEPKKRGWGRVYFCSVTQKCSLFSTLLLTILSKKYTPKESAKNRTRDLPCRRHACYQLGTPPVLKINKEYIKGSQNGRKRNLNLMVAAFTCTLSVCLYISES